MTKIITIGASPLNIADVIFVALGNAKIAILPRLLDRFSKIKVHILEHWTGEDGPQIYSLNTGLGEPFAGNAAALERLCR